MFTFVIVEDHRKMRLRLRQLLEDEGRLKLVAETGDGAAAVRLCARHKPDLLVTDLMLPGLHGLGVIGEVLKKSPATRVVVVSIITDDAYVDTALRKGALGYVDKERCGEHLIPAVQAALAGRLYLSPPLQSRLSGKATETPEEDQLDVYDILTRRERWILQMCAEGLGEKEIAAELGLEPPLVRRQRVELMRKLRLKTKADLVRFARSKGLVPGAEPG